MAIPSEASEETLLNV